MTKAFIGDLLGQAEAAVQDAESWLEDADAEQVLLAIAEARTALDKAQRAVEDGIR
jgi:hypothetical protein